MDDDDYIPEMSQYHIYVVRFSIGDMASYRALFPHEVRERFHRVDAICITAMADEFRADRSIDSRSTYADFKAFIQGTLNSKLGMGDNGQTIEKILRTIENYSFIVSVERVRFVKKS